MPYPPPVPSNSRPLSDLEGYAFLRRKFFSTRQYAYLRLSGAVISVHLTPTSPLDWDISILHASIDASHRRFTLTLTLPTSTKLYLQFSNRALLDKWTVALQLAASRDFSAFYSLEHKIGEGAFATVHRATCLSTGRTFAVKCVKKRDFDAVTARELDREMFAMRHLRHPAMVAAHDVFNTLHHVYIVMDFMHGGTLKENVQAVGGRVPEGYARPIMRQVLTGCAFLHRHGYVHRDIKLENVLCDTTKFPMHRVRLADFGYVNFVEDATDPCLRSLLGTPVYIAPEIIARKPYAAGVDVYAAGVMLYRMISGHYPYDGRDDDDRTLELAAEGKLKFGEAAWRGTSRECRSFVRALLHSRPGTRLTAQAALLHEWLSDDDGEGDVLGLGVGMRGMVELRHKEDREMRLDTGVVKVMEEEEENGVSLSPVTPAAPSSSEDGLDAVVDESKGTGGNVRWVGEEGGEMRRRWRRAAAAVRFVAKLGVVAGVRAPQWSKVRTRWGAADGAADGAAEQVSSEGSSEGSLVGSLEGSSDEGSENGEVRRVGRVRWHAGGEGREGRESGRRTGRASSTLGRASGSRRWGSVLGDRLKRTMSMGTRR